MREQQQQEAMDADAALLEMKQATQRLDEILQHMCVATSSGPPDAELIDSEDAFADAHEHASDQAASVSFRASDDVAGVQHRPREEYASAKDYFSVRTLQCGLSCLPPHMCPLLMRLTI